MSFLWWRSEGMLFLRAMAIPASNTHWKGQWSPEQWQKGPPAGVNVIGKIVAMRFHSITSASDVYRYNVSVSDL